MTRQELKEYSGTELIEMVLEAQEALEEMQVLLNRATRQALLNQEDNS